MQISDNLSLKNVSFGKKVDHVSPYNEIISWEKEITLDRLVLDGSPFYLRKSPASPQLIISEVIIKDKILDGVMNWFSLDKLSSL